MKQIDFLNTVRDWASELYNERIPVATDTNLKTVQGMIYEDAHLRNEFFDIVNKVGKTIIHTKVFENPLSSSFNREEITFGNVIEEIGLDKIEAKVYDPSDLAVYATNKPTMKALYNIENLRLLYDTTRNGAQVQGAFQNGSFLEFMNAYTTNLLSSYNIDEFLIEKEMLKSANYCEVNIPALDGTAEKTTNFVQAVRTYISKMKYPSRDFNELGFLQSTPIEDLRLICVEEVMNEVDLKVLASMFNKDMAQFKAETLLVDNFNDDGDTYAIICDKMFLNFYTTLRTTRELENPRTLDWTFILHVWGNIFTSKFLQAVKIRKEVLPTSATISSATKTLDVSEAEQATLTITATAPSNASYTQYVWTSADEAKVEIVSQTYTSCKIKAVGGTANDTVVITATNLGKNTVTATCTVTLV